jgi:hypothetical protein
MERNAAKTRALISFLIEKRSKNDITLVNFSKATTGDDAAN